jgi:large subunit ribosomal protein L25
MILELKAQARKDTGRKLKTLREKGFIPAVVYGPGHKPASIQVAYNDFKKAFDEAGESTLIKLEVDGHVKNVLIHDVSIDPIDDTFIHIDFYQVVMDKTIKTHVPLVFAGEAPAVKGMDGVLIKNLTELEIEALPKDLPHEIKVDISSLDSFDKHIRIKDLPIPEGVKVLEESEELIVSVIPPRSEEELKALEEKPEEKVEEVEKVGEKPEEGEGEEPPVVEKKEEKTKEGS